MDIHTKEYEDYLKSEKWAVKRIFALHRAGNACERCGYIFGLQVHHKHYRNLGHEPPEDLEVLCLDCHKIADVERKAESARHAQARYYNARLDGWARKKYGEDWEDHADSGQVEEDFDAWLERRDDRE